MHEIFFTFSLYADIIIRHLKDVSRETFAYIFII